MIEDKIFLDKLNNIILEFPKNYISIIKSEKNKDLYSFIIEYTKLLDSDIYSLKTRIYWTINKIKDWSDKRVRCSNPYCKEKNGTPFIGKNIKNLNFGYVKTCCKKCERDIAQQNTKQKMLEKYGVENPFQIKEVIDKIKKNKDLIDKKKKETRLKNFGDPNFNNSKQAIKTKIEKYGSVWNLKKIQETKLELHGDKNWNNPEKNSNTKKLNNTCNTSISEFIVEDILKQTFSSVLTQYKSEKYPFNCDFYIPEYELYVEYNESWTHGNHPFDENCKEDIEILDKWKLKNTKYYDNAIHTWTIRDIKKRKCAKENNLNYTELWNISDAISLVKKYDSKFENKLMFVPNASKILSDFNTLKNKNLKDKPFPLNNAYSYMIKYFQQEMFYKKEKEMWKDALIQKRLIENRCKYLKKTQSELTALDLLDGFKIAGLNYGYSHFNPMIFKWFIQNNDIKTCYDPCGGWGHRLIGSLCLEKYIYNDLSKSVKENVDKIVRYFNLKHVETACNDARQYVPEYDFESMFTCPPYFNLEHYECGDFKDMQDYEEFINSLFRVFYNKESCRIFGLVIREDFLFSHTDYAEKHKITKNIKKYLTNSLNKKSEYLYIFKK